jgi:hypothetical protein
LAWRPTGGKLTPTAPWIKGMGGGEEGVAGWAKIGILPSQSSSVGGRAHDAAPGGAVAESQEVTDLVCGDLREAREIGRSGWILIDECGCADDGEGAPEGGGSEDVVSVRAQEWPVGDREQPCFGGGFGAPVVQQEVIDERLGVEVAGWWRGCGVPAHRAEPESVLEPFPQRREEIGEGRIASKGDEHEAASPRHSWIP